PQADALEGGSEPTPEPGPEPEPPPEPASPPPRYPDPREYLRGFAGRCHWEGPQEVRATDWYAAPRGSWVSWPVPLTVTAIQTPGPMGPLPTAIGQCDEGEWAGWRFLFTHAENIQTGYFPPTVPFFQLGRGGIEALPGDPDHIHFFADAPGGAS